MRFCSSQHSTHRLGVEDGVAPHAAPYSWRKTNVSGKKFLGSNQPPFVVAPHAGYSALGDGGGRIFRIDFQRVL